ncbi:MAG: smpB [Gammaproteobacteria bacterium]|jgi:SsrA-binding protein|nr:smpB [Gammaproteobacteria bacterium]
MYAMKKQKTTPNTTIALNKKAHHSYFIEERFEAGLVLEGWEVKSLRAGRAQLKDSYVVMRNGEAWLLNSHISTLKTTSTHTKAEPERSRKLLLHAKELNFLIGAVQREGYTLIPLALYWKKNRVKLEFGVAKGKHLYDKRETEKKRDWERERARLMK